MTHLRLWTFEVPADNEERFVGAYRHDGEWARLFAAAPGFIRTELWRSGDGLYLTADYWRSSADFEMFQSNLGDAYRKLDRELEGIAVAENFVGAFELAD
jgi:heme-degrading monooxygenase HmoA